MYKRQRYDGKEFNDIIDAASTAEMLKNPQARWDSLAEAEKILLDEDVAVFPTVQNGLAMLINPKVHGLEVRNTKMCIRDRQTLLRAEGGRT